MQVDTVIAKQERYTRTHVSIQYIAKDEDRQVDQVKDGATETRDDGRIQKMSYSLLLLMELNSTLYLYIRNKPISSFSQALLNDGTEELYNRFVGAQEAVFRKWFCLFRSVYI